MGLHFYGLMLIGTNAFAIEAGVMLTIGLSLLAAGSRRYGHHLHPIGAPPDNMDLAQAADPRSPK